MAFSVTINSQYYHPHKLFSFIEVKVYVGTATFFSIS